MADTHYHNDGINYSFAAAVTPHDSTELDFRAFFVGGAGDVAVKLNGGSAVTLTGCLAGVIYPIGGKKSQIMSTNTTATSIVLLR